MDFYYEETAKMKNARGRTVLRALCVFFAFCLVLVGFWLIYMGYLFSPNVTEKILYLGGGALMLGGAALLFFKRNALVFDFDYIIVNGEMKIVRVNSNVSRTLKADVKSLQVGKIGRYNSEEYRSLTANPKTRVAVEAPNKPATWKEGEGFYFAYTGAYGTTLLVLQCSEAFVRALLRFVNRTALERGLKYEDLKEGESDDLSR